MGKPRPWWRQRRVKHRDAVILCVVSSAFLLAGEIANPVLASLYASFLQPALGEPAVFAFRVLLVFFGFTTAFGAVLVLTGGWYFLRGRVSRGRALLGLGVGVTSLSLLSRLAYYTLVFGSPVPYLVPLATTLTGAGVLFGTAAHTVMGQYALLLKKQAWAAWRRWRRARRAEAGGRARA